MTIALKIRNYRAIERADIDLSKIALIAGKNEAGKSSVAQAARAALCGVVIPVAGVLKKDAKVLVRDGEEEGLATASEGERTQTVTWPKGTVSVGGGAAFCTPFAAGLEHLFDLSSDDRARALAPYVLSQPTDEEIGAAAKDIGYSDHGINMLCTSIGEDGWDATLKRAREYGTKMRGQWEETAGEAYGSKKAEGWTPPLYPKGEHIDLDELTLRVEAAKQDVIAAAGSAAVSAAEVKKLREAVAARAGFENELDGARAALAVNRNQQSAKQGEFGELPSEAPGRGTKNKTKPCPSCGTVLIVEQPHKGDVKLVVFVEEEAKTAATPEQRSRRATLEGELGALQANIVTLEKAIATAERGLEKATKAEAKLGELPANAGGDDSKIVAAREAERLCQAELEAFNAKARAAELHGSISKNDKLLVLLAPDGLRRRKLAAALTDFNNTLALMGEGSGWPTVRLDENLNPHYGTRPVWAASESGQWRARATMQILMAVLDGSRAIVLDGADVLDAKGRNGLFKALGESSIPALVCMTFSKPELVPNLAEAGIGQAYWVDSAVVSPL